MNRNKLFNSTRWRLASWYAGVMGFILGMSGLAIYVVMDQVHWSALHQELETVAGTLHDGLEPKLQQPGRVEPAVEQSLPGLCIVNTNCTSTTTSPQRHIMGAAQQEGYYVRLLDLSGQLIATVGSQPPGLPLNTQEVWQTIRDQQGNRYHQISIPLKTATHSSWGYLQVGRSLREFDAHLITLRWVLLVGLPLVLIVISVASWWLAGLAMRPVYQSYRHIQQFTADAAHELRTPLAAVRATVQAVLRMPQIPEAESRNTLQTIERQNARLSQLVQDLLLLSRMDARNQKVRHQACCLNDIVSDVVEEFAALALDSEVLIIPSIRSKRPLDVLGDEEQLYRLLANLVTNAIQYTPPHGRITVILEQEEHQVVLQVQDTGIGIAPQDQTRIFERFYRVSGDRSRQTGGSGLGLAIAQAIVQTHQGSIQVQSELGKGSTFTVRLPILNHQKPQY